MADSGATGSFVSGFVSILGRPNVGKSTLLNALLGEKVTIVSDKPQTTRTNIQGVLHLDSAQIIFLDTPGIHSADSAIHKRMLNSIEAALDSRDLLLLVTDCTRETGPEDEAAVDLVKETLYRHCSCSTRSIGSRTSHAFCPTIDRYRGLAGFEEVLPISALTGKGREVKGEIVRRLPAGPRYFPEDEITDQPLRFLAGQSIREKVLIETRQEVPHAVLVLIDKWEEQPNLVHIMASIVVEREGQKAIIIGAGGLMLKQIGTLARQELEHVIGRKVYLELFVKVRSNWRQDPGFVKAIDWRS